MATEMGEQFGNINGDYMMFCLEERARKNVTTLLS